MTGSVRERAERALAPLALDAFLAPLDPVRLELHAGRLSRWVGEGRHASMDWLARSVAARSDPRAEWPWARSVLVVRVPYRLPFPGPRGERPEVAGYARKDDYHVELEALLRAARKHLEVEFPGLRTRWFCDALPVPEVELAVLAGAGWRGRHGLLIDRRLGSAFHLGGMLLDLEGLDAPAPHPDHCGNCRACLDACPTGALDGLSVDGRLCLAHWNIEDRSTPEGVPAREVRSEIAGCDLCQQACPWNRRHLGEIPPREGDPVEWEDWIRLCLPQGGFQSRFKSTPLDRPGRAKVLRVLLRALENVDRPRLRRILPEVLERETRPDILQRSRRILEEG